MFEEFKKVVLKAGTKEQYLEHWRIIANHMTTQKGASASTLRFNKDAKDSNEILIHWSWPRQSTAELKWSLLKNAPEAVKQALSAMQALEEESSIITKKQYHELSDDNKFKDSKEVKDKKQLILIYSDTGTGRSVDEIYARFAYCIHRDFCRVLIVNADYLRKCNWEEETRLIVIPGGKSIPFYTSLGATWTKDGNEIQKGEERKLVKIGDINKRIVDFVSSGGDLMGVCAGGYYGAKQTIFDKNGPCEVISEGALNLFNGVAIGPANSQFKYDSEAGAEIAEISCPKEGIDSIPAYLNGGCYFQGTDNHPVPEENILAVYKKTSDAQIPSIAIVESSFGDGQVILSGVHFEYKSNALDITKPGMSKALEETDEARQIFFAKLVNRLEVPIRDEIQEKMNLQTKQRTPSSPSRHAFLKAPISTSDTTTCHPPNQTNTL